MPNRFAWSLTALIAAAAAFAQVKAPTEFEVASVRPNTANDRIVTINVGPGGRFAARGYTLGLLMQRAYGVMGWNVSGGPEWIRTDRFDVAANASVEGNLTEAQLQPMLQRLLAQRFKLSLHRSSKEMPGYALVVAKNGPKVKPAADRQEHQDSFRMGGTGLSGQGIAMQDFARFVGGKLGLVAVDETRLKGLYDFKADWKVEADPSASALPDFDPRDALRFAVFTALQEQLGLKLAPKKITVQMLVIDNAERASASEN
ncbi:MAG: TIGR03435 family protein [Acidobacteriia bacterium]|nr:TIGR03435 family protein [Terriglobia bacterium]